MKITKTMEEMGNMIFDFSFPIYVILMLIYLVLVPIWLPIYLVTKFIEIYKKS